MLVEKRDRMDDNNERIENIIRGRVILLYCIIWDSGWGNRE